MAVNAAALNAELDEALDTGARWRLANRTGLMADDNEVTYVDEDEADEFDDVKIDPEADSFADLSLGGDDSLLQSPDASPASMSSPQERADNIRVFVRVRPPNAREGSTHLRDTMRSDTDQGVVHLLAEPPRSFAFDGVLAESASQEEVFQLAGISVAEACLSGYNGSIYVYGQTGSGKTHTMQGPVDSVQSMHSDENRGLMCRILDLIFSEIGRRHQEGGNIQYTCKCSYLEIYKEQITDLLEPGSSNLQVREDINRGIYVERLSEHSVWTVSDAFHVLWKGLHQRHVASTQMNELSSRSHSVFTLKVEASSTTAGGVTSTRVARLSLIDLAGSERQSFDPHNPSLHESLRVKEAGAINRSLSALTNVIMSLSHAGRRRSSLGGAGGQRRPFVRYRDSKLTFLLRDSLGGNSKTVIVACASPSALCFGETLSTLKFAARAKHIRCSAVMNEEYSGTVESLMLEVKSLRQQLDLLSSRGLLPGASGVNSASSPDAASSLDRRQGAGGASGLHSMSGPGTLGRPCEDEEEAVLLEDFLETADLRRLYGPRRVRRLEILLAAALEKERRCELRRHKLEKFTQYLDGLLERKEQYFDALRDYFAFLVDTAAGEACYLPELTARLVVFRQQLCNASTDSSRQQATEMLDGTIEAFLAAEADGLLDEDGFGVGSPESSPEHSMQLDGSKGQGGLSPQRWLANEFTASRSRSYSYGLLMGEAARRNGRKSSSQVLQLRASAGRLCSSVEDSLASPSTSSAALPTSPAGAGSWEPAFSGAAGGPAEEELSTLRMENRLLRRQLERHPELHRLGAENRLLREHLASLVQQQALSREEPAWPRGHRHQRRAMDGSGGGGGVKMILQPDKEVHALMRDKSLTRTSKSSVLLGNGSIVDEEAAKGLAGPGPAAPQLQPLQPFPGIEEATQISQSSSSETSDGEESASSPRHTGRFAEGRGQADVTSFLPTMAREVEELFRVKYGLEESLRQLRKRPGASPTKAGSFGSRFSRVLSSFLPSHEAEGDQEEIEVEAAAASEAVRAAAEALRCAEGMLAKGNNGETLLLASGDEQASDYGFGGSSWSLRSKAEGMDERDVFLSLMRSLPGESQTLSRQGFSSSAPHLPANVARKGFGSSGSLRTSSSTGSAGSRMQRTRSTMQLHRIAEQPSSPSCASQRSSPSHSPASGCFTAAEASSPGEMLRDATKQVRSLCEQLENVGEAYRDVQGQLGPMQEEYLRRLEECRFLEAKCRRLGVHCSLLEERTKDVEASAPQPRQPLPTRMVSVQSVQQALSARLQACSSSSSISASSCQAPIAVPVASGGYVPAGSLQQPGQPPLRRAMSAATVLPSSMLGISRQVSPGHAPQIFLRASARQIQAEAVPTSRPAFTQVGGAVAEMRRVVSAPQLQVSLDRSVFLGTGGSAGVPNGGFAAPAGSFSLVRPFGGASSVDAEAANLEAGSPSFKSSVFLSLARQPGAKTAALQYLVSSTSSARMDSAGQVSPSVSTAMLASPSSSSTSLLKMPGSAVGASVAPSGSSFWASQGVAETRRDQPSRLGELLGATFVSHPGTSGPSGPSGPPAHVGHLSMPPRLDLPGFSSGNAAAGQPRSSRVASSGQMPQANANTMSPVYHHLVQQVPGPADPRRHMQGSTSSLHGSR